MNSFGKSFSWSMLINCRFVSLSVSSFSAAGDSVSTCKASNARLMLGSAYHAEAKFNDKCVHFNWCESKHGKLLVQIPSIECHGLIAVILNTRDLDQ